MKIYCDSSLKEACFVPEGQEPHIIPYLEPVTVNVGEYKAVILALEWAKERKVGEVEILADSQLVVRQVTGNWKCKKAHLLPYRDKVIRFLRDFGSLTFTWIPREENLAGKVLEG